MSDARWFQACVRAFHLATGQPAPGRLDTTGVRLELRAKLILEEAHETIHAMGLRVVVYGDNYDCFRVVKIGHPDWPAVIDGLCDLLYVTLGTAVEAGIWLGPFFAEVHRSNLAKVGGPVRPDGKRLKPEGWKPPRIRYLWDRLVRGERA